MDFRWHNVFLSLTDLMAINWQWHNLLFPFLISFCAFSDFQIWPWICAILCVLALLYLEAQKRADQLKHKDQLQQQEMEQSRVWETKLAEECQKLVNLIAEKDEFAQESRDRAVKILEMDKQLEDTLQALAESEKSKETLKQEMNDRLIELENMYKHQQDDMLKTKQCHFDQALAESEKSKAKAQEEMDKLLNKMETMHKNKQEMETKLADSEQSKDTLQLEVGQLRDQTTELAQSLENAAKMTAERDALAKEKHALLAEKEKLQGQLDEMTPKMAEREATFKRQMDELRQALANSEQFLSTFKRETVNLITEKDEFARESCDRAEKNLEMYNQVRKQLKQLEDRRETELSEERKKTANLTAERDNFARESRDRNDKIGQMDNEMKKQHKQLEELGHTNRAQQPSDENGIESHGQIVFRMPNFKAFSQGQGPDEGVFSPDERINGVPWRIKIKYNNDWIKIYLNCNASTDEMPCLCLAACQFSVVSRTTKSDECLKGELDDFDHYYADRSVGWSFAKFEKLMDPKNGFYDEESDSITFKAEVVVKKLSKFVRFMEATVGQRENQLRKLFMQMFE